MAVLTNTTQKRNAWLPWLDHCPGRNGGYVNHLFFGRTVGGVADVWADAFTALEMALRSTGYTPRSAWAYNFRGIGGAHCSCGSYGSCSLHGQGTTVDIDPKQNPYIATRTFRWSDTAFTPEQIAAVEGIKNTKGEQMWFWGGRWTTIKDYMHFEPNVDPGSTMVDWSTVPGSTKPEPGPEPQPQGGSQLLPISDKSSPEDIKTAQDWLNYQVGSGETPLKVDGVWGPASKAMAKKKVGSLGVTEAEKNGEQLGYRQWNYMMSVFIRANDDDGGAGITSSQVDAKIAAHAKVPASATVHPHRHAEGTTGPPVK